MVGHLYIPTLGRTDRQRTLEWLPKSFLDNVRLVCPPSEVSDLERRFHVKALACPAKGIAPTRQWIIDQCPTRVCSMCDDDQRFYKRDGRKNEKSWNLTKLTPDEVVDTLSEMEMLCDSGFAMVGLCARQGNQNIEDPYIRIASRVHNQYAVDVEVLRKHGIRFDAMTVMEDFYVNLALLYLGIETCKIVDRVWDQVESNMAGGCSTYRTALTQAVAATMLQQTFPECVALVEKQTAVGWFGDSARTDVRVQWKQALELGKKNPQFRKPENLL